jgi:hypothetical protein
MAGNKIGGVKAAKKNKELYGEDFYRNIGKIGGKRSGTGGFWHQKYILGNTEAVVLAGAKGGRISKRPKKVQNA